MRISWHPPVCKTKTKISLPVCRALSPCTLQSPSFLLQVPRTILLTPTPIMCRQYMSLLRSTLVSCTITCRYRSGVAHQPTRTDHCAISGLCFRVNAGHGKILFVQILRLSLPEQQRRTRSRCHEKKSPRARSKWSLDASDARGEERGCEAAGESTRRAARTPPAEHRPLAKASWPFLVEIGGGNLGYILPPSATNRREIPRVQSRFSWAGRLSSPVRCR